MGHLDRSRAWLERQHGYTVQTTADYPPFELLAEHPDGHRLLVQVVGRRPGSDDMRRLRAVSAPGFRKELHRWAPRARRPQVRAL